MPHPAAGEAGIALAGFRRRVFAGGLLASAALHAAAILSSPYWLQSRTSREIAVAIDLAEVPAAALPPMPPLASASPPAGPPPEIAPPDATATAAPRTPPSRQEIRREVSRKGLLRVLARRGPAALALSRLGTPGDAPPVRGEVPGSRADRAAVGAAAPTARADGDPGASRHIRSAPRASTAFAARVFTTDAGLEGRIEGGGESRARSESAILATIERHRSGIKYAYDRELRTNPALDGEITVSFVILPDGSVSAAAIRRSTVGWPSLEEAVLARVRHMRFAPAQGAPVRVQFPFRFLPQL